jgi:hypothetical protein
VLDQVESSKNSLIARIQSTSVTPLTTYLQLQNFLRQKQVTTNHMHGLQLQSSELVYLRKKNPQWVGRSTWHHFIYPGLASLGCHQVLNLHIIVPKILQLHILLISNLSLLCHKHAHVMFRYPWNYWRGSGESKAADPDQTSSCMESLMYTLRRMHMHLTSWTLFQVSKSSKEDVWAQLFSPKKMPLIGH